MATITPPNDGDFATDVWPKAVTARLNTGCALFASGTTQSVSTGIGSLTTVTFSAAQVTSDPGSWFSDANDWIAIPEAGTYFVWGYAKFTDSNAGARRFTLKVGSTNYIETLYDATIVSQALGGPLVGILTLALNDKLTLAVAQSSGGALDVITKGLAVWRLW